MTPINELCEAYKAYRAQIINRHTGEAHERLCKAVEAWVAAKGWQSWRMDLVHEQETHTCKCTECGNLHVRYGRRPGLYINDKSLQQLVDEEAK